MVMVTVRAVFDKEVTSYHTYGTKVAPFDEATFVEGIFSLVCDKILTLTFGAVFDPDGVHFRSN